MKSVARKWMVLAGAVLVIGSAAIAWTRRAPRVLKSAAPAVSAPLEANLSGSVEPRNTVSVQPPAEGVLDQWFVEVGQPVYKDQLLARVRVPKLDDAAQQAQADLEKIQAHADGLDSAQMAAKLEISRAEAEKARADGEADRLQKIYERYKSLWDLGAIARLQFEQSEKDYKDAQAAAENADKTAKAAKDRADAIANDIDASKSAIAEKTRAVEQAKEGLSAGDLHSPVDGIVIARQGAPGQPVDPSMKNLIQIATDLTQLRIEISPSPDELARLHARQPVTVEFDGEEISSSISEIRGQDVIVDFNTSSPVEKLGGTAQVRIKF